MNLFFQFFLQVWAPTHSFISRNEEIDRKFRNYIENNILTVRQRMKNTFATLQIPMFEIDSKIRLKDAMKQLGIKDVFERKADLSPMLGKNQAAKVSDISHAVKLAFDANGVGVPKIPR